MMTYDYKIVQGGITVAPVSAACRDTAWSDILHYAAMYRSEGPLAIYGKTPERRRWRVEAVSDN
jgi:hypothetical protein